MNTFNIVLSSINDVKNFVNIVNKYDFDVDLTSGIAADQLDNIPVLTLRNMVLFPDMTMPVAIGRSQSLQLINDAQQLKRPIAVVCQIDSKVDNPHFNDLYKVGTVADIIKILQLPDNTTNVILRGRKACQLNSIVAESPYLMGNVTTVTDIMPDQKDREYQVLISSIKDVTNHIFKTLGENANELAFAVRNIDSDDYLVNFIATNIPFDPSKKQEFLEERNIKSRAYIWHS